MKKKSKFFRTLLDIIFWKKSQPANEVKIKSDNGSNNISNSNVKREITSNQNHLEYIDDDKYKELKNTLFLNWCDGKKLDVEYPRYFSSRYNMKNLDAKHKKLIEDGSLIKASDDLIFKNMTVSELKEVLRKYNLKVSGKKQELIDRLIDNNIKAPTDINDIFILSDKGKEFIKENHPWITYHKFSMHNITEAEFVSVWNQLKASYKFTPPGNDIVWKILSDRAIKAQLNNKFTDFRFARHGMFDVLVDENKISGAVKFAIEICTIDLSGLNNYPINKYNKPVIFLAPYFVNYIANNMEYYNESGFEFIKNYENISVMSVSKMKYYLEKSFVDFDAVEEELRKKY